MKRLSITTLTHQRRNVFPLDEAESRTLQLVQNPQCRELPCWKSNQESHSRQRRFICVALLKSACKNTRKQHLADYKRVFLCGTTWYWMLSNMETYRRHTVRTEVCFHWTNLQLSHSTVLTLLLAHISQCELLSSFTAASSQYHFMGKSFLHAAGCCNSAYVFMKYRYYPFE